MIDDRNVVPQFVVVRTKHGEGVYRTSDVRNVGRSNDGTHAAFVADMPQPDPNKGAVEITLAEYDRLKAILAPGQR